MDLFFRRFQAPTVLSTLNHYSLVKTLAITSRRKKTNNICSQYNSVGSNHSFTNDWFSFKYLYEPDIPNKRLYNGPFLGNIWCSMYDTKRKHCMMFTARKILVPFLAFPGCRHTTNHRCLFVSVK